jgi:hypothetical protein
VAGCAVTLQGKCGPRCWRAERAYDKRGDDGFHGEWRCVLVVWMKSISAELLGCRHAFYTG